MKYSLPFLIFLFSAPVFAQLGFCEGSKGDPIFHEDFGSGNHSGPALPATTTSYRYITGDPQDGQYTISNQIGVQIAGWHSYLPNTTISNERALIVNADYEPGLFYTIEIPGLCENTTYEFSAFLLNIYNRANNNCPNGGIPINVKFQIWDENDTYLIKEGDTGDIPSQVTPQWGQYALTFQTQAGQGSVILKMFNNGVGGCGNDLAIDDIIFRSCGDLTNVTAGNNSSPLQVCEIDAPINVTLTATPDYSVYQQHFFQWQESEDDETWLDIPGATLETYETPLLSSTKFYRVKVAEAQVNLANSRCSSASGAFQIDFIETPLAPVSDGDKTICANEPIPVLNVTANTGENVNWYDAPQNGNMLAENSFSYTPAGEGTFYAEAYKLNTNCSPGPRTAINLTVNPVPMAEDVNLQICDDAQLLLDAGEFDMVYVWSTGATSKQIFVSSPGNYSVEIITPQGCTATKNFEVRRVDIAIIEEIVSNDDTVSIITTTLGEFEYSLDGVTFQRSNRFERVPGGVYTGYVRDLAGCNLVFEEFPHIVAPKFFTPNNDGYNDYFTLNGLEYFASSNIKIFDRFGKLITSGRGVGFSWDGNYNASALPAADYWYEIYIEGYRTIKGNVSLIR